MKITEKKIDKIMDGIDMDKFRSLMVFSDIGYVWIHPDSSLEYHGTGTSPGSPVIAMVCTPGRGNIDESVYADGWCVYDEATGEYIVEDDGRRLTPDEMLAECLEYGDFPDDYWFLREEIENNNFCDE